MAQQFGSMELGWAIGIELPYRTTPPVCDPTGSDFDAVDETFIARAGSLLHSKLEFPERERIQGASPGRGIAFTRHPRCTIVPDGACAVILNTVQQPGRHNSSSILLNPLSTAT
jgi:hypothetical protein